MRLSVTLQCHVTNPEQSLFSISPFTGNKSFIQVWWCNGRGKKSDKVEAEKELHFWGKLPEREQESERERYGSQRIQRKNNFKMLGWSDDSSPKLSLPWVNGCVLRVVQISHFEVIFFPFIFFCSWGCSYFWCIYCKYYSSLARPFPPFYPFALCISKLVYIKTELIQPFFLFKLVSVNERQWSSLMPPVFTVIEALYNL